MNIGKEILLSIRKQNIKLCEEFTGKMMNTSTFKALAEMYFEGDDWSMENDFPSAEIVRKYKGGIEAYGIKVDTDTNYQNEKQIAFLGESKSEINYSRFEVGKVIVRHLSEVKIFASGNSVVFVNLLDAGKVEVTATEHAKIFVYCYGDISNCTASGNVSITNKSWAK